MIGLVALAGAIAFGDFLPFDEGQPSRADRARKPDDRGLGFYVASLEVFLYDWWPIRNEARLSERLSAMPIRIRYANAAGPDAWRADWPAVSPRGERKTTEPKHVL